MRKAPIVILLLVLPFQFYYAGWQEKVDSLKLLIEQANSDSAKTRLYIELGNEVISNNPYSSLEYFKNANKLAKVINDTAYIIKSMLGFCDFYNLVSEYGTSLEFAYQALDMSKDNKLLALCHNRLAGIHHMIEEYDKALAHNRISLGFDKLNRDTLRIAADFHNIGTLFLELDEFDSALYYLYQANEYTIKATGKSDSYNLSHIGLTYTYMNTYDSALFYHNNAFIIDSVNELIYEMATDEYYLALTYFKKGDLTTGISYANRSINRGKEINLMENMLFNYELLYQIYEKQGQYKNAFKYALLRNNYADSLREKSKQSLIQGLEIKYKMEEQERQLNSVEAKNELLQQQKTLLVLLSLVSLLLLASTVIIIIQIYRRNRANRELLQELEKANQAKEKLISIISHDLRGSIGTFRNTVETVVDDSLDYETTREIMKSFFPVVDSTYDLLENLLTWAKHGKENLEPMFEELELKSIINKSIAHTNHLALSKNIEVVNMVNKTTVLADRNMLQVIIRNLISNAVKFSNKESKVIINSTTSGTKVEISVQDEGVGMKPEVLENIFNMPVDYHSKGTMGERGSGLGLSISKTFIEKQGGEIWAVSTPKKGSTFYFTLPLASNNLS